MTEFTDLPWMDALGWLGAAGLFAFYWLLGSKRVLLAYIFGTLGAAAWLVIGILTELGYAAELPSLIVMEAVIIVMNVRGIIAWRAQRTPPKLERACDTCWHFETFPGRDDTITGQACRHPEYACQVTEPQDPPCGGLKWTLRRKSIDNGLDPECTWCNPLTRA